MAKEDQRYGRLVQCTFNTHKPISIVATMTEVRNAYAVRDTNPFIDEGAQCSS
jgi:hypothetical protein